MGNHSPWDGTGWDITAPDIDQPIGNHYKEMYDLRKGVAIRANKEHTTYATSSAGGIHKNGAAVAYEGTDTPTNRPDGSTALGDNAYDRGRLWLDDNFDLPLLKRWNGSAFEIIGTLAGGTTSQAFMHNTTHEDTENGRESQIRAYGEQSGGEKSTLGFIEFSHDGTSDDQKGRIRFVVNDGDDDDAPSKVALVLQSDGAIDVGDSLAVLDEDDMASDSATKVATQQSTKAYADTKLAKDGSVAFTGTGDGFKDEDDMSSDSATAAASQQSIKAYIAAQIAAYLTMSALTPNDSEGNAMVRSHAYKAQTDGIVFGYSDELDGGDLLRVYIDTDSDPVSGGTRVWGTESAAVDQSRPFFAFVAKDEYFEITHSGSKTVNIFWRSFGTLAAPIDQD